MKTEKGWVRDKRERVVVDIYTYSIKLKRENRMRRLRGIESKAEQKRLYLTVNCTLFGSVFGVDLDCPPLSRIVELSLPSAPYSVFSHASSTALGMAMSVSRSTTWSRQTEISMRWTGKFY